MPVPVLIDELDVLAELNYPLGGENVFPNLDNYLRAHAAFIAQLRTGRVPSVLQKIITADTTLVAADANVSVVHLVSDTTARTVTVPAHATVAYDLETYFLFSVESGSGAITIAMTSDTMYLNGVGAVSSYVLQPGYTAHLRKLKSTFWYLSIFGPTGVEVIADNAAITTTDSYNGKLIYRTSGTANVVLSASARIGTAISGINDGSTHTITVSSGTLYLAGSGVKASISVPTASWWSAQKVTATRWYVTGSGVS